MMTVMMALCEAGLPGEIALYVIASYICIPFEIELILFDKSTSDTATVYPRTTINIYPTDNHTTITYFRLCKFVKCLTKKEERYIDDLDYVFDEKKMRVIGCITPNEGMTKIGCYFPFRITSVNVHVYGGYHNHCVVNSKKDVSYDKLMEIFKERSIRA